MTHHNTHEGASKDVAGKGKLDDEMLPDKGDPVEQEGTGGNTKPQSGKGDDMAPEAAKPLGDKLDKDKG